MNQNNEARRDLLINDARMAADDMAGALENLADLYASLAVFKPCGGADEKRLAATFATLQTQAARVAALIASALG